MKRKNLTPFAVGTKLTSRRPPQREMTIAVRGKLRLRPGEPLRPLEGLLGQGGMTSEAFAEGDEERAGEALYPDDFADFKLRADVLLKATCHPPGGRAAAECSVRFSVGPWSKTLRVFGRRVWTEKIVGQAISDPAPFASMPLRWSSAFGGPGFPANPVGNGLGTPELPTVEYPNALLRSKGDRPPPAGAGPVSSTWPQRAGKLGREYGESYRKKRAPFYAEDFDWTYFNAAPPDQQLEGYLRGDEELTFTNLHPGTSTFAATLPGLRLRAFVKSARGEIAEVPMVLDTLFADVEEEALSLTWRGLTPVEEDDFKDVQTMLVASEPLAGPPLPIDHYVAVLEAFERDPLERDARTPPEAKKAMEAARQLREPPAPGEPPTPASAVIRAVIGEQIAEMPPEQRASAERALAEADAAIAKSEEMRWQAANDVKDAASPRAKKAAAMRGIVERAGTLKAAALQQGLPTESFDELDKILADPAVKRILEPRVGAPGPGEDFADQDLSGEDLSGRDLRGASFAGARMLETKLVGACLAGCNLKRAILAQADLTGADLTGADLTEAVLLGARAAGADLSRTTLARAIFDKADLTGARFDGARADMVAFSSATLSGVSFRGAVLHKAFAKGAPLDAADFTGADLTLCLFLDMKAEGILLRGARLERTSFARSDLKRARVNDARGQGSIWTGATLDEADFSFAVLPDAQLAEASARGAVFHGADLRGARFYRAVLDEARFFRANLAGADLNKASLNATVFRAANLYDAKLLGAKGRDCDFEGANTARARFEEA